MNNPELTPNQIRDQEEHARVVRERWDGKMPVGDPCAKKTGGYIIAIHKQRVGSHAGKTWELSVFIH
jgi:hypothetical protein